MLELKEDLKKVFKKHNINNEIEIIINRNCHSFIHIHEIKDIKDYSAFLVESLMKLESLKILTKSDLIKPQQ
jgi:hypothetical protein